VSARDAGSSEDHAAMTLRDEIAKALAASNSWMLAHECRDSADALLPIVERVAREGVMLMHESCIACITAAEDTEHVMDEGGYGRTRTITVPRGPGDSK
jgi:hypothetical protein